MNSITMNFDDTTDITDINIIYNQLKKQYPKIEIIKNDNPMIDAMKKMQEAHKDMEAEVKKFGIYSEEEFMDWINGVIKETRREQRSENNI